MSSRTFLLLAALVVAGCASASDPQRADAAACEQPTPALGSLVVRRERCVALTEEERLEARRRAREMMEEQGRSRDSARSNKMGG
jgi:hypothetical protein